MADDKLPDVPVEHVERPSGNLLGKSFNQIRYARKMEIEKAKRLMFERHKVTYRNEKYYKIVEDKVVTPGGKEFTELRLYQLIDGAVVTIKPEVTSELEGGINHLLEFKDGK